MSWGNTTGYHDELGGCESVHVHSLFNQNYPRKANGHNNQSRQTRYFWRPVSFSWNADSTEVNAIPILSIILKWHVGTLEDYLDLAFRVQ